MSEIRSVQLELLRHGPAHNQLLSPLTPYLALCGGDSPVTIHMPFEQRQLLNRLERLRYSTEGKEISGGQREGEVREMGEVLGRVLGQVPALLSELGNARAERGKLVHFRLSLSAFELGLVPFEVAIAPDGFPGSGSPLFLQSRPPISLTREIRRGQPLPVDWNRKPRILFAFAAPAGFAPVPAQAHLLALRRAIDPWVKLKDKPEDRLQDVKAILTVLPDASLEKIRQACLTNEFTHVHILAHGAPFDQAGDRRYGIALCSDTDATKGDVVDGERLAIALMARDSTGASRYGPTIVNLATCDSGNVSSVLTPGGSIAHELHAAGIPWVIASQFPLWMRASSIAAEVLFDGLLKGDDPRWVLYVLRQRLRTDAPGTHDWASIVAYATVPWDFEQQVDAFRDKQTRSKVDVKFARIDELVGANEDGTTTRGSRDLGATETELRSLCASIREDLTAWRADPAATASAKEKAERLGMSAASEKRIGIAYDLLSRKQESKEASESRLQESKKAYEKSRDFYRKAIATEPYNHWVITQYLSILATPVLAPEEQAKSLAKQYGPWWVATRQIAEWQLHNATGDDRAWALATLAELSLLGVIYSESSFDRDDAINRIVGLCQSIRDVSEDRFPVSSTSRQFKRYLNFWCRKDWEDLAQAAVTALADRS
jgi:hypothetical protein